MIAICNFKLNKNNQAVKYLNKLEELRGLYQYGSIDYAIAQFYVASENKVKVEQHLLKALAAGHLYTNQTFQNDPHFIEYKNTPFFKNIMTFWN